MPSSAVKGEKQMCLKAMSFLPKTSAGKMFYGNTCISLLSVEGRNLDFFFNLGDYFEDG